MSAGLYLKLKRSNYTSKLANLGEGTALKLFLRTKQHSLSNIEHHFIDVTNLHRIHVVEAGNRAGPAVVFLHGGPGSGVKLEQVNYIDCDFYHLFLIDQRGAGQSYPSGELLDNNLSALVADIERVRKHFDIRTWLVTGGSWGALLAVSYTIAFHQFVDGLILRGCFLGRPWEIDWLYSEKGAARFYPEVWKSFVEPCPNKSRNGILSHYLSLLTSGDELQQWEFVQRWLAWASISMQSALPLINVDPLTRNQLISKAKIMCYFLSNSFFLNNTEDLLAGLRQHERIPIWLVSGREDIICPPITALQLSQVHSNTRLKLLNGVGHSPTDKAVNNVLWQYFEETKER